MWNPHGKKEKADKHMAKRNKDGKQSNIIDQVIKVKYLVQWSRVVDGYMMG